MNVFRTTRLIAKQFSYFVGGNSIRVMSSKSAGKHSLWKTRPLRVLIDMDGVLCDFEGQFLHNFRDKYPNDKFIPLEKRNTFYIDDQYTAMDESIQPKARGIWLAEGFFRSLPPIEGAIDAIKDMSGLDDVQVFLCTSPLTGSYLKNHYSAKEKFEWVETHLGKDWLKRLIITRDKTVINGDILIDDKPKINGMEVNPAWDHILFTSCHNKHLDVSNLNCASRLDNWTDTSQWKMLIQEYKKKIA